MNNKMYNIKPSSGEALLSYNGRLSADDLYMKVYEVDNDNIEKVNIKKENELNGEIYESDCLSLCAYLKDNNREIDFAYIDPPFATNVQYTKKIFLRNKENKKIQLQNKLEEGLDKKMMYDEIWSKEDYLNWMYTRLVAIREILSERGAIMVHLDTNIGHYVKILLDEVFGEENFINEIIWSYRNGGTPQNGRLPQKHDTIYFYSKNSGYDIALLREKNYKYNKSMASEIDENGNGYNKTLLRDVLEGTIEIEEDDGTFTKYKLQKPNERFNPNEFLDYPHQRPKDLLKLLLRIATKENFIVADFFGGSGTTALAAYELNRRFITCDIEKNSIQIMRDELKKAGASFIVKKINDGINLFKDPVKFKSTIIKLGSGIIRDEKSEYSAFWDGKILYNKKMLVTKILNNNEILTMDYVDYLINQLQEEMIEIDECILIYFYKSQDLNEKDIREKINNKNLDIKINIIPIEEITKNISDEIFDDDSACLTLTKNNNGTFTLEVESYYSYYLDQKIKEENYSKTRKNKPALEIKYNGLEYIESISIDKSNKEYWVSDIEDKASKTDFIQGTYILDTDNFKVKIRNIAGREIIIQPKGVIKKYEQ